MKPWLSKEKKRIIAILVGLLALTGLYWYGGYSGDSHGFVMPKETTEDYKVVMGREYTMPAAAYASTKEDTTKEYVKESQSNNEVSSETASEFLKETASEAMTQESFESATKESSEASSEAIVVIPSTEDVAVIPKKRCSIIIECHTLLSHMDELNKSVAAFVPEDGIILKETYYEFEDNCTAFDVLCAVCKEYDIPLEYSSVPAYNSYYIEGIAHLYEFDCGNLSGWMYGVNGRLAEYASNNYEVCDGDLIFFSYTCNIGNDLR